MIWTEIQRLFCSLCEALGTELLLTERHGEKVVCVGDFSGFEPDVVSDPGRKIRVRTEPSAIFMQS